LTPTQHDLPAGLRGDYAAAAQDYTLPQDHAATTAEDHATWRRLYDRQAALFPRHAAKAWRDGLARLDCAGGIPAFDAVSRILRGLTGWSLVAVPGLIPGEAFFAHLAARRFPVTTWIRRPEELDYIVEPDVFHDFLGHVPLLTHPDFARFIEAYGALAQRAAAMGALEQMSRLYWHMVEFGLIEEDGAIRAYGAGILSSAKETLHATTAPGVRRLRFAPLRVLRSAYFIDDLQPTYFVIRDYAELYDAMAELPALLAASRDAPTIPPGAPDPSDIPIPLPA
jgi:phenylalanine-4-hydroxylase